MPGTQKNRKSDQPLYSYSRNIWVGVMTGMGLIVLTVIWNMPATYATKADVAAAETNCDKNKKEVVIQLQEMAKVLQDIRINVEVQGVALQNEIVRSKERDDELKEKLVKIEDKL